MWACSEDRSGWDANHPPLEEGDSRSYLGHAGVVTDTVGSYGTLVDTHLRVLTWNLWWRFGPWEARRPAIAATLARLDADVLCLQEVWDDGTTNFAAELAEGLGYHHVYGSRLDHDGVKLLPAVFVTRTRTLPLRRNTMYFPPLKLLTVWVASSVPPTAS